MLDAGREGVIKSFSVRSRSSEPRKQHPSESSTCDHALAPRADGKK